jgi:hypothetical protein
LDDSSEDLDDDNDLQGDGSDSCDPDSGDASNVGWSSDSSTDYDDDGCQDSDATEDDDDDNDGISDSADDCATGDLGWTSTGATDYDTDGCQDSDEDLDDDNDGALDDADSDDNNIYECSDNDQDGCEDCSSGTYNVADDGSDSDSDGFCDAGDVDLNLHAGANSISFFALPSSGDYSVGNIFGDDGENNNVTKVFGEGVIAFNSGSNGWIGYLTDVAADEGYWAILDEDDNDFQVAGLPTGAVSYAVHAGNNFLSYSYSDGQAIGDGLPSDAADNTQYIYGEGEAAINTDGGWAGTLGGFVGGKGYWFGASTNFTFSYNVPAADGVARYIPAQKPEVPVELAFKQSPHQYFYFIDEATVQGADLNYGDWIVAYNNETVVGSRMYTGTNMVDIPIMGEDISVPVLANQTAGYCKDGDIPSIKIRRTTGEVVDMHVTALEGSLAFSGLGHAIVTLSDAAIPTEVSLHNAYPNPFNPSTMIEYELSQGSMHVNLSVFDLRGRLVAELVNEMQAGDGQPYQVVWNAEMNASGLYFVQLTAGNTVKSQKIMLIK